jgi:hypothetical protein
MKTAFVLEQNVEKLFRTYPIERMGFLTISFPKSVATPKEASKRFNSFNNHFIRVSVEAFLKVTEPHKDQRPHYHLLTALKDDIRTGFDWESQRSAVEEYRKNGRSPLHKHLTNLYAASASSYLRFLWKSLREAQNRFRLGRIELLPIRSNEEAAIKYIGKYIQKGSVHRTGAWKGVRLTSQSKSLDRAANSKFSWVNSSRGWRQYLAEFAKIAGIKEYDGLQKIFGDTWAYKLLLCMSRDISPSDALSLLDQGRY